jgi:hypothetical protein
VTPAEQHLEWRYGPSWRHVVTVIETVRTATPEQMQAMSAAWHASPISFRAAAISAAWHAAMPAAWSLTKVAVWVAARDVASDAASDAACYAAWAAAFRDLRSQHGYTADYEAALIGPYASVFGLPWAEDGAR